MMAGMTDADEQRMQAWRRQGPAGYWQGAAGSHASVAGDEVWFGPEGEGWVRSHSPLFGEQRVTFRWRPYDDAEIEILPLSWPGPQDEPDEDDPPQWQRLRWEPCEVRTDIGRSIGLRERGHEGFWIVPDPLVWVAAEPPR